MGEKEFCSFFKVFNNFKLKKETEKIWFLAFFVRKGTGNEAHSLS